MPSASKISTVQTALVALTSIADIITGREYEGVEFKRSVDLISSNPESVERTVAALANSMPNSNGLLVFGVEDNGTLLGLKDLTGTKALSSEIVMVSRQQFSQLVSRIRPVPTYKWQEIHHQGCILEVVSIQGRSGSAVYTTSLGRVPHRIDSYTFYADAELIDAWRQIEGLHRAE